MIPNWVSTFQIINILVFSPSFEGIMLHLISLLIQKRMITELNLKV
jgi:hypothetical protein